MFVPSRKRFDETADHYREHRPGYPPELIDWVVATSGIRPGGKIVDLGCGTGISTRAFASRGFDVVGIDPSQPMLDRAVAEGGARYLRGESTTTGLPDHSVDLAVCGQAFHWFDVPATLAELRRILVPGAACAAFWNLRADSPFLREYDSLLKRCSTEYPLIPRPLETIEKIRSQPEVVSVQEAEFQNRQWLDAEGLVGRAASSSYVVHGVERREEFECDLGALFERHQCGGRVEFAYRTVVLLFRIR